MEARRSERGFTLIELLGVLFILLAVVMTGMSYRVNRQRQVDRQAAQVAAALRLARAKAVLRSAYAGVKFNAGAGTYQIFEDVGPDGFGPADPNYPGADSGENNQDLDAGEPTTTLMTLKDNISFGIVATLDPNTPSPDGMSVNLGSDPIPATNDALVFGPRGQPSTDMLGSPARNFVYLTDPIGVEMRAIRVDPWTGSVQTYRWDSVSASWSYQ